MENGWNVGRLLATSGAFWPTCTIHAAVRLEIFTVLGDQWLTAPQVSERLAAKLRGVEMLLDALTGMGLLDKEQGRYRNTKFASEHLIKERQGYMGHIILHHHTILDGWVQLHTAVSTGEKVNRRSYGEDVERESFLMGMFNLAMGLAPKIVPLFDLSSCRRLLDLGGGPGTYAIHFCQANPQLNAVVYDRPSTAPFAEKTIARFGLSERIKFQGGDFVDGELPRGPFDVAWLSHILHSNSVDGVRQTLEKTAEVLGTGGTILIHDFFLDESRTAPEFAALFSLNMLVGTEAGRSYSFVEVERLLEEAGFTQIRQLHFASPNDSSVVVAEKV